MECPVEAIKLFCSPRLLLHFSDKALVQQEHHHPKGELLLQPKKFSTFDNGKTHAEESLGLEDLPSRRISCYDSFWRKHQSKVYSAERPALLVPLPSLKNNILDQDINLRLPSRWETQKEDSFEGFKLPAFAASSPSSITSNEDIEPTPTPPHDPQTQQQQQQQQQQTQQQQQQQQQLEQQQQQH